MSAAMIETAKITIVFGDDENYRKEVFSGLPDNEAWNISVRAISGLINEGSFDLSGTLTEAMRAEIFSTSSIVIEYSFSMPTSFFREQFGQRPGFLSSVFGSFERLVILPNEGAIQFFFISGDNDGQDGTFHAFLLADAMIYDAFEELFLQKHQDIKELYVIAPSYRIFSSNPIGEQLQMLHVDVRPFVLFFFPNPAAASMGTTINGVYTYMDSSRVVKFYPNNVVEYNALPNISPSGTVSLASSLLAALDMLDRDKAAMLARGNPMNDVFLAGYSTGPMEGQWNFYFNYVVGRRIMEVCNDIDSGILNHAAEIQILNNEVLQYRRLMLNFYEGVVYEYRTN